MRKNRPKIEKLSTVTRNSVVKILDLILHDIEAALITDKDIEKRNGIGNQFGFQDDIDLKDVKMTTEILNEHLGRLGFKFPINGIDRLKKGASWKKLHQEIKSFRDSVAHQKPIMTGDKIVELLIVQPKGNNFLVVINQKLDQPIKADSAKPSWRLLLQLARQKEILFDESHKTAIDYFNSNRNCKLYTRTGLSLTKILQRDAGFVKPAIKISIISEKTYKRRLNSQPKST